MRVYLPSTLSHLARVLAAGEVGPAPLDGYAVTPSLREWYADGDLEELEYAAMAAAARASLKLLAGDPDAPRRRVVLAADLPDRDVAHRSGDADLAREDLRALVGLAAAVPWRRIAAGHVDDREAIEDVEAAVAALPAAEAGDEGARFAVDGAEGHELLWYATQELRFVPEL